jgi:hypothetical protein
MGIIDKKLHTYYTLTVYVDSNLEEYSHVIDYYEDFQLLNEIAPFINNYYFAHLELVNNNMVSEWFKNNISKKKENKYQGYIFKIGLFVGYK